MTDALHTTTDPHLAAFLVSEGATLADLRRVGPKTVLFSFATGRKLHLLLRAYWGGYPIRVVPAELFDALHRLKCRSITRP